jgi:hypothetical protein
MSLNKVNTLIIAFSVIIIIIGSITTFVPRIMENLITGFASIATFNVGATIIHATIELGNRTQLDPAVLNGTNITIMMPVTYYDNITMNLSIDMPTGFECGFRWYINESGTIKSVSGNTTALSWEADKSIKDTQLYFDVPPPMIISEITYMGNASYEKTFTIDSCCPLTNVSANISVSTSYQGYTLYLVENGTMINKSSEYHFQVTDGNATFYGFNLSNKTFMIQVINTSIVEEIIRRGGGGIIRNETIPHLNRSQEFLVEPNYISITSYFRGFLEAYIMIYNFGAKENHFNISYTKNFIAQISDAVTVPPDGFIRVPVLMNTDRFAPGKYKDYIIVKSGYYNEQVIIELELLEQQKPQEIKVPSEEQPVTITPQPEEAPIPKETQASNRKSSSLLILIIIILIGLGIMVLIVLLQLRSKPKTVKNKRRL